MLEYYRGWLAGRKEAFLEIMKADVREGSQNEIFAAGENNGIKRVRTFCQKKLDRIKLEEKEEEDAKI